MKHCTLSLGLPEGSRREEVVRFLEAATLLKGISHPHIVPVLRVSVEDGYVPLVVYPMLQHPDMHRVMKLAANPEHSALPVSRITHTDSSGSMCRMSWVRILPLPASPSSCCTLLQDIYTDIQMYSIHYTVHVNSIVDSSVQCTSDASAGGTCI